MATECPDGIYPDGWLCCPAGGAAPVEHLCGVDLNHITIYDRVKELSYTIGTGNFVLSGPVPGFSSFDSVYESYFSLFYAATDGQRYEIGSGAYVAGTISRFPIRTSNANNLIIDFPEGTKEIYATYPATHAVYSASGIKNYKAPQQSGIAYWYDNATLTYDSALVWDENNNRLGLNQTVPQYGLDLGGSPGQSIVHASGFIVKNSGIYFPPLNDGDSSYSGGRQLRHYEPNRLDDYAIQNQSIGHLTGSSAVLELSGIANNYILFKKQNAGLIFAGPPSGCSPPCSPAYPSFRPLIVEDIPNLSGLYVNRSELVSVSGLLNNRINSVSSSTFSYVTSMSGILNSRMLSLESSLSNVDKGDIFISNNGSAWTINNGSVDKNKLSSNSVDASKFTFSLPQLNGGRLTLESGVPVSISDQKDKSTVFFCPYNGNAISLYNGSNWNIVNFANTPLSLSNLVPGALYDIFAHSLNNNLFLRLSPWLNSTTRNLPLILKDGVYCASDGLRYRYLGTIRATSANTTEDSKQRRHVWNIDNAVDRPIYGSSANPVSWTYNDINWRNVNNSYDYEISIVNGLTERPINIRSTTSVEMLPGSVYSLNIASGNIISPCDFATGDRFSASGIASVTSTFNHIPSLGYSNFFPIESCSGNSVNVFFGNSGTYFGGTTGSWKC